MVEEMLAARGICVTYETVRQWAMKFGKGFSNRSANGLRLAATNGIWMKVCRVRTTSNGGAALHRR